ncbi:flavanone 3-dioxygenase 3-like [Coffea arabica]|uniref:Flavanone 3-dioxygenase 3-like n=1 Tax=Coffea arabica TaxID=13443 RepID=A0A6P6VFS8_COFAR|nr:flavanone 3-dioxygenase 3-like [Coffea arabica]
MEDKRESSAAPTSFTSVLKLSQMGAAASVPKRYVLPPSQRPNLGLCPNPAIVSPIIDLSSLHHPIHGLRIKEEVRLACKDSGFFQVINHGIPLSVMNDALDAATDFFELPHEEKMSLASANIREPVRYGTSLNHVEDRVLFWRDFIKHYSHPISTWIDQWPSNPKTYKEKMGNYTQAVHALHRKLMGVVFENLGLSPKYLHEGIDEGSQVMAVNCYPTCPEPDLVLGMPPHSDYGYMTIILQNHQGLEIMSHDKKWYQVPVRKGALVIQIGDQMEIISNGLCKSLVHRATVNSDTDRISIASLHSLALERKVGPAPLLVDDQHPLSYAEGSFSGFLDFISNNDIMEVRYIDALKKNP